VSLCSHVLETRQKRLWHPNGDRPRGASRLIEEAPYISFEIVIAHGVVRVVKVLRRNDCLVGLALSCRHGLFLLSFCRTAASVNRKGTAV
jgi:hypothetical protein